MTAPAFTPGPWNITKRIAPFEADNDYPGVQISIPDASLHTGFHKGAIEVWGDDPEANARLIAAAPELYDEAAFLCARLREMERDLLDDEAARQYFGHCSPSIARLESILAQASGETVPT